MGEGKQHLISIIVPVYQVKEYVGECVESLTAQTYTNLEILLVDYGSTDGSGEICDEHAYRDNRIRVIHQENRGLSGARNTGLDQAIGEYVAFVDSDDVVLPDFIETLYDLICRYRADIAACAFTRGKTEEIKCFAPEKIKCRRGTGKCDEDIVNIHGEEGVEPEIDDRGGNVRESGYDSSVREICMTSEKMLRQWHGKYKKWETIACNKVYRKQIWNGIDGDAAIRFPIGRRHEDVLTSHLIMARASRVVLTTRKLYLYRTRADSITTQVMTEEHRRQNLLAQRERMAFFKEKRYLRAYLNLLAGYVMHVGWFGWKRLKRCK